MLCISEFCSAVSTPSQDHRFDHSLLKHHADRLSCSVAAVGWRWLLTSRHDVAHVGNKYNALPQRLLMLETSTMLCPVSRMRAAQAEASSQTWFLMRLMLETSTMLCHGWRDTCHSSCFHPRGGGLLKAKRNLLFLQKKFSLVACILMVHRASSSQMRWILPSQTL